LPFQGILVFNNAFSIENSSDSFFHSIYLGDYSSIVFSLESEYVPVIGLFLKDESSKFFTVSNAVIHIYPKEQLNQIGAEKDVRN
jgi:hypothetical protein